MGHLFSLGAQIAQIVSMVAHLDGNTSLDSDPMRLQCFDLMRLLVMRRME